VLNILMGHTSIALGSDVITEGVWGVRRGGDAADEAGGTRFYTSGDFLSGRVTTIS